MNKDSVRRMSQRVLAVALTACFVLAAGGVACGQAADTMVGAALKLQTGPILGASGPNWFTVACRTNEPAVLTLTVLGTPKDKINLVTKTSEKGKVHQFRVEGLDPKVHWTYYLLGPDGLKTDPKPVRLAPAGDAFRFVAMGDCRKVSKDWAAVAAAAAKADPAFVLFSGDMVSAAWRDEDWDDHFFGSGRGLLTTTPFYPVLGNHENKSPVADALFCLPPGGDLKRGWAQEIAGVLFIGVNGAAKWDAGGENVQWLEKVLADSKARFIFFVTHYPAWSSGKYGRLNPETGKTMDTDTLVCRNIFVPLLLKHHATAMFVGHDHLYERSELPGGLTHIIAGRAGAPVEAMPTDPAKQNPYSKALSPELQYCLVEVQGDTCTMKCITPAGKVIDTCSWKARQVEGAK